MAIGPVIGHVLTCHFRGAEVTVSVVSTTVLLTVESSIDLATVGRTMETSLASLCPGGISSEMTSVGEYPVE